MLVSKHTIILEEFQYTALSEGFSDKILKEVNRRTLL